MITTTPCMSTALPGYRFPREVIAVAVRWYLRYGLSYRDVEELLAERGITVDHVTIYRWVQTFTAEFIDAARAARHSTGPVVRDETYVKVAGRWTYLYRAVDQHGQIIDVFVSTRRNAAAARECFARALRYGPSPVEVTTDWAPVYPRIVEDLKPAAVHVTVQYANNIIEADHGRLKARLRPMRGLKQMRSAPSPAEVTTGRAPVYPRIVEAPEPSAQHVTEQYANNVIEADHGRLKARLQPIRGLKRLASARTISAGHAFMQNLRRGHYAITVELPMRDRVRIAFDELAICL